MVAVIPKFSVWPHVIPGRQTYQAWVMASPVLVVTVELCSREPCSRESCPCDPEGLR